MSPWAVWIPRWMRFCSWPAPRSVRGGRSNNPMACLRQSSHPSVPSTGTVSAATTARKRRDSRSTQSAWKTRISTPKCGRRPCGSFVHATCRRPEYRGRTSPPTMHWYPRIQPAVYSISINGPYQASGPGDTPCRRRILVFRPATPGNPVRRLGFVYMPMGSQISNNLSWSSPTTPLPAEAHPRIVFERLFGDGGSAADRRRARSFEGGG